MEPLKRRASTQSDGSCVMSILPGHPTQGNLLLVMLELDLLTGREETEDIAANQSTDSPSSVT